MYTDFFTAVFIAAFAIFLLIGLYHMLVTDQLGSNANKTKYKYYARKHIMTSREENFFKRLETIFVDKCYVFPQINLSKLFKHEVKGQSYAGAFQHINRKSVDYILVRKSDFSLLCAIELDDSTHNTAKRKARDEEVDRIFNDTNTPIVHFLRVNSLSDQEIVDTVVKATNRHSKLH